jgi:hypothetical protein
MATYSNNTTIKFKQAVTLVNNSSYTIPAGCYAIMGFMNVTGGPGNEFVGPSSGNITIDGISIVSNTSGDLSGTTGPVDFHIPEGKVVTVTSSGKGGTAYALMSIFQNTP